MISNNKVDWNSYPDLMKGKIMIYNQKISERVMKKERLENASGALIEKQKLYDTKYKEFQAKKDENPDKADILKMITSELERLSKRKKEVEEL